MHNETMKNQKGFSVVEGVLILVIIGLLGGVGWYVWDSNKKTKQVLDNTDKGSSVSNKIPNETNANYLVIKEWSVKVPLDSDTTGLEYSIGSNGVASFRTTELNKFTGDNCANSINVARGKAKEIVINELGTDEGANFEETYAEAVKNKNDNQPTTRDIAVKIGDYYFVPPGYAGASCASDKVSQDKETTAMLNIVKALNS